MTNVVNVSQQDRNPFLQDYSTADRKMSDFGGEPSNIRQSGNELLIAVITTRDSTT